MLLIGRDMSPFVRRVVVSLRLLDIPFERAKWATGDDGDKIAALYPMKRVPVMQLDDGEVLIDSAAILDWIDETVGPDRALIPPRGKARRDVLQICALAQSTLEKALAVLQEREQRPPELVHEPRLAYCKAQLLTGLAMLEARTPAEGWLLAGRVTQADITLASAYEFIAFMLPDLLRAEEILHIAAHHGRAAGLPGFAETSLEQFRK